MMMVTLLTTSLIMTTLLPEIFLKIQIIRIIFVTKHLKGEGKMSVKVERSTKYFNHLSNMIIQIDDLTIDKLAPGESTIFELPNHLDHIKVKSYFSKKEIAVSDGDVIKIERNTRMIIYKTLLRILLVVLLIMIPFRIIESPTIVFALMLFCIILTFYIDYSVPDFSLIKTQEPA